MAYSKADQKLARMALAMKRGDVSHDASSKAHKMMREMSTEELRNMASSRDYDKEYEQYHGKPEQIKNRAERNTARREMGLRNGDGKEVDHKRPLSKGGSNSKSNLRVTSRTSNRRKYNK